MNIGPSRLLILLLLAAVAAAAWSARPLIPPGETRELAVSWEMHQSGDPVVPTLNGEPYSGSPPLKYWLMQSGWLIFGPSTLWARLLGPFAALLGVIAIARAARMLWGDSGDPAWRVRAATMVFVGMVFVQMLATAIGGGLWLGVATILAWTHLARARDEKRFAWAGLGLATGIGLLAAGPVALLFTLPPWLAGRAWAGPLLPRGWWVRGIRGQALGVALFLAWAVPASWSAGGSFATGLFVSAPEGMLDSGFPGGGDSRWTVLAIVMLAFPWLLWSPLWRGWLRGFLRDPGMRLMFLGTVPALLTLFVLRGGLRPHDLVPALPAFALCAGRILETRERAFTQASLFLPSFATMAIGAVMVVLPTNAQEWHLPGWVAEANGVAAGSTLMIGGLLLLCLQTAGRGKPSVIAAMGPLLLISLHIGLANPARNWDLTAVSRQVAQMEREGIPVAYFSDNNYQGQFHFLGRLQKPIAEPRGHAQRLHWLKQNPTGAVLVEVPPDLHHGHLTGTGTTMTFPYREGRLALWKADELLDVLSEAGRSKLTPE